MLFTETVRWHSNIFEISLEPIDHATEEFSVAEAFSRHSAFKARCRIVGSPTWRERQEPVTRRVEDDELPLTNDEIFYWVAQDFINNAEAWEAPEIEQGEGVEDFPVWGEDSISRDATMGNIPVDHDPAEDVEEPEGDVLFDKEKGGFIKAESK